MRRKLLTLALMSLTIGLLGSCKKEDPKISVTDVTLNSTSLSLIEGESLTLSATVSPQNAANKAVIWSTSNASVATVDEGGKVVAVATGSATITVKTDDGGKTATCSITVNAKVYPVESVSLDKTSVELTEGETETLTASVTPDNASDKTVSWSSSQEAVATVKNGVISAVGAGEATITVITNNGGKTATCAVTVKAAKVSVTDVTLNQTELILTVGDSDVKLTATVAPENATDKTVSWSSDDTNVATVDIEGNLLAIAPGTANITVTTTDGGKTATCAVTVKAALPEGALPGEFSVSATKKVLFSKGNLWYGKVGDADEATWNFETNQYDFTPSAEGSWDASHINHFFWSKTASVAYAESYSESDAHMSDVFFTNATEETAKVDFTVNGVTGKYRALYSKEWMYLFKIRTMANGGDRYENLTSSGITIEGVLFKGVVLFPDDFIEQTTWKETYTTWEALNNAGLVFLPAAGGRGVSGVLNVGYGGYYWSSLSDGYSGSSMYFTIDGVSPNSSHHRDNGFSVRLITESNR